MDCAATFGFCLFLNQPRPLLGLKLRPCLSSNVWSAVVFPSCSLRPLDVEFMRRLSKVVNIVPVIAKADTLTLEERDYFKQTVNLAKKTHFFNCDFDGEGVIDQENIFVVILDLLSHTPVKPCSGSLEYMKKHISSSNSCSQPSATLISANTVWFYITSCQASAFIYWGKFHYCSLPLLFLSRGTSQGTSAHIPLQQAGHLLPANCSRSERKH